MGRLALALVAILALAGEAEARTRYLSPTGHDTNNTGLTALSPWKTFYKAVCGMSSSDTLYLAAGTYTDGIVPRAYCGGLMGTAIIGDSINPNRVIVPSVNLSALANATMAGTVITGIRVSGNVTLYESPSVDSDVDGIVFRACVFAGNFIGTNTDFAFDRVRAGIGQDSASSSFRVFASQEPVAITMDSSRVIAGPNATYPNVAPLYTHKAIEFASGSGNEGQPGFVPYDAAPFTITATRCTLRIEAPDTWAPEKPTIFQSFRNCRFSDNLWQFIDSTGVSGGDQGVLFRDRIIGNIWLRDVFQMRTQVGGTGAARVQLTGAGSSKQGERNVWRYCTFTSNVPTTGYDPAFEFQWQMQPGDSFYRNVVVCSTGANGNGFGINNVKGSAYVGRNTFVNFGTGGAFMLNADGDQCTAWNDGTLTLESNIFYSKSTGTGANDYATAMTWPHFPAQPRLISDYNLFSHYGSTTGLRSIYGGKCSETARLFNPGDMDSASGNEKNSLHGSPRFTDTTSLVGFNAALLSTSAAIAEGRGGVDCGAMDFDTTRPDEVSDLSAINAGSATVALRWTATGDDSLTGTPASYTIRYSTSLITEANWSSATNVTGTLPTPSVAGSVENMVVSGLTANTFYFFAMKVNDEIVYTSALSNNTTIRTQESGPDLADP